MDDDMMAELIDRVNEEIELGRERGHSTSVLEEVLDLLTQWSPAAKLMV
jgi:hypothetical protein